MRKFQFHDIDELISEGVSDDQLRQLVSEANRYRVVREGSLNNALSLEQGLPHLEPNQHNKWDDQLDRFIAAHRENTGKFKSGDLVTYHFCSQNASDWYKQRTGLTAEVIRAWTPEGQPTKYEVELRHNRHVCVCTEQELITYSTKDLAEPWWCAEVIEERSKQLYVRLAGFSQRNSRKLLSELTQFVQGMATSGSRKLHVFGEQDEPNIFRPPVSIEYDTRFGFYAWGDRSNRAAALSILNQLAVD